MRNTFTDFLATLAKMTEEDRAFFSGLVHETATLHDLLTGGSRLRRLGADWLDASVVRRRVFNALTWATELGWEPRETVNIFFQEADTEVDGMFFALLLQEQRTRGHMSEQELAALVGILPGVHYLHTCTNWYPNLSFLNLHGAGRWSIRPLMHYSSLYGGYGFRLTPVHPTLGYNLPNFPELLGVSSAVASEYFARIVAHDVLHSTLPLIGMRNEALHDLAILHAGGAVKDRCTAANAWEQFVLDECTDVACRVGISERLIEVLGLEGLTATQMWYVRSFFQEVLKYQASASVCELLEVPDDVRGDKEVRTFVAEQMARERERGFPSWNTACDDKRS